MYLAFAYCNHPVNGISLGLAQSDPINWHLLFLQILQNKMMNQNHDKIDFIAKMVWLYYIKLLEHYCCKTTNCNQICCGYVFFYKNNWLILLSVISLSDIHCYSVQRNSITFAQRVEGANNNRYWYFLNWNLCRLTTMTKHIFTKYIYGSQDEKKKGRYVYSTQFVHKM